MTKFKQKEFMFLSLSCDSCFLPWISVLTLLFLTPTAAFELDHQLNSNNQYNNQRSRNLRSLSFKMQQEARIVALTVGGPCNKAAGVYCAQGEYCVSSVCTICPAGSYCPGNNEKENCIAGTISVSPGATSCSACPPGKYSSYLSYTSCMNCIAGGYCPGAQDLIYCPEGTYSTATDATAPTVCTACAAGKYTYGRSDPCENCEPGYFCTGASSPTECDPTSYRATASATTVTQCTKCKTAGYYGSEGQDADCSYDCDQGAFCLKGAGMQYCPAGKTSLAKSDAYSDCTQITCRVGKACYGANNEIPCQEGFIVPSNGVITDLSQCVACPVGKYSGYDSCYDVGEGMYSPGAMQRLPCPQGRYSTGLSGTSWTSCSASPVCPPGQQLMNFGSSCAPCSKGSYCPGNGDMFFCPQGTYSASTAATSARDCLPCPAGTFANNVGSVSCSACRVGSYCPEGGFYPIQCADGTFSRTLSAGDAAVCSSSCTAGFTPHDSASGCVSCRVNSYCAGGTTAMQKYQDGFFSAALGVATPSSCTACAAGTYITSDQYTSACQVCIPGGYCPAASDRIICPAGTANKNAFSTSAASCVACAAGFYSDADMNTCSYCPFGFYCPGGSAAIPCPAGTYATASEGTSATICTICPAGKYSGQMVEGAEGGWTSCFSCMFGFYCPGGSMALPFPAGTTSSSAELTDASSRTVCAAGKYSTSGDRDLGLFCSTCLPGHYCPGPTYKIICPMGTYNPETGSTSISACLPCAVGTYGVGERYNIGPTSCQRCTPGSYCPTAGKAKVLCPEGTFNPDGGSTTVSACVSCPAGKFSAEGSVICTTCKPGSYCPGATNQIACDAGYYSTASGAISINTCQACAAGTYSDKGAVACSTCTAGQYCPGATSYSTCGKGFYSTVVGATTNADCKACVAGYYSELNAHGCHQCFGGVYCPGASYYVKCPAGKYNSGSGATSATACLSCAAGTYAAEGAIYCATCPPGHYCPAASDKVLCPAGKTSTGNSKTAATSCSSCSSGSFANPEGTFCLPCRPGSYCPSGGVAIACVAGKYGVTSKATASSACVVCAVGTYEDTTGSIMCKLCSIGTKTGITGSTSCICKAGYYCPDPYTEIICPAGTTSAAGASECSAPPTIAPTAAPSVSFVPTQVPTNTAVPSAAPSIAPSAIPSMVPSIVPTTMPSVVPTVIPSEMPSAGSNSEAPSTTHTTTPSAVPSVAPTSSQSESPSAVPTSGQSESPSAVPSVAPTSGQSESPSAVPSVAPTSSQSESPSAVPSVAPTSGQSESPSAVPSVTPTSSSSESPSAVPSVAPTSGQSKSPSAVPSVAPTSDQSESPSAVPSVAPTSSQSESPSAVPSVAPTSGQSESPSAVPSVAPTSGQSKSPSAVPSVAPTSDQSESPSAVPSVAPTSSQSESPSAVPTVAPTADQSVAPSGVSVSPSTEPTIVPSVKPSRRPSVAPSFRPSRVPSTKPSLGPTPAPTVVPFTEIAFDASLFLSNVSTPVLDQAAQSAVCSAVTETVGVADENCEFTGQTGASGRRQLAGLQSYRFQAQVRVTASTGDFEDTVEDTNGDNLYAKLTTLLETAVETKVFTQTVRDKAVELNASAVLDVSDVNFTASAFVVISIKKSGSNDGLSDGEYAGIIISAVFVVLVVCYCVVVGVKSGSYAAVSNSAIYAMTDQVPPPPSEEASAEVRVGNYELTQNNEYQT